MPTVSIDTIQELIAAGRIIEARTLIAVDGSVLGPDERDACLLEIGHRENRAEALIAQAEAMEQAGRIEEAKALYASVVEIAADFPGIEEHTKRMDEALFLARAVQRRNKRIRESATHKEKTRRNWLLPALGAGLVAGLAATVLIVALNRPAAPPAASPEPAPPQNPVAATAPQADEPPAAVNSAPTVTPPATPAEPPPSLPPTASPAEPPPVTTQPAGEPHPADRSLPFAAPTPTSQPSAPNPAAEHPSPPTLPTGSSATAAQDDVYTVQPGDSLSLIAERQLCHEPSWRALHHLNQDRITDPRKLQPGMQLRLTGLERRCPARP